MSTTTKRLDALLKQRADALRAKIAETTCDAEPADGPWQPASVWARAMGLRERQGRDEIRRAVAAGLMETKRGRWRFATGLLTVPLYREVTSRR